MCQMELGFIGKTMEAWRNGRARIQANGDTHTALSLPTPSPPQGEVTRLTGRTLGVTEK